MRAEIVIRSLKPDGEVFEFSDYIYNTFNHTVDQFEKFVENNAEEYARESCEYVGPDELDYVGIVEINFDEDEL